MELEKKIDYTNHYRKCLKDLKIFDYPEFDQIIEQAQ
jgi:hypothetical protein